MESLRNLENEFKTRYENNSNHVWEFSQMFGEEDSDTEVSGSGSVDESNDYWISSLSFDSTGKFLAVGYYCGQVVVLKQQDGEQTYQLYNEFKSHDSEFDCLTSMEIEEKIGVIKWFPFPQRKYQRLLTTNDKTIKMFRLKESSSASNGNSVKTERVYSGGHSFNINGISFNSDGETFISSDDLRINLWHVDVKDEVFNIVDIKPENMDDLSEIITSSDLNPKRCNELAFSSSKGTIRLGDMRDSALCERFYKVFDDPNPEVTGYFQELVTSIGHIKFSPCGRFIAARDYLTTKIWDPRYEKQPIKILRFHEHLNTKLYDMYENECIYDKFEICWSSDSSQILTGSYNNTFYVCDAFGSKIEGVKATKPGETTYHNYKTDVIDPSQKILKSTWNPKMNSLVLGAKDFGYIYHKRKGQ